MIATKTTCPENILTQILPSLLASINDSTESLLSSFKKDDVDGLDNCLFLHKVQNPII